MNCDNDAVALLTFSPTEAKAWLYDLEDPDPTAGIMLCRRHANATVVPMSWQLVDSRDPAWPGPAGSVEATQAMAAASAEEFLMSEPLPAEEAVAPVALRAVDSTLEEEFAALQDEPAYATTAPRLAAVHTSGRSVTSDLIDSGVAPLVSVADEEATELEPEPSLFELPINDIPAVTRPPGY